MEHGLLRRYFAAFSKISGFSNWVIAKASLEFKKPEIKNICLGTETGHSEMENKYAERECSEMYNECNQTETGYSEMDNGNCDRNGYDADRNKGGLSDCIYKYNGEPTAEILRQKKNYALMSVSESFMDGSKIRLDIHLIKIISRNENGFNSSAGNIMSRNENGFNSSADKIMSSTENGFNSSANKTMNSTENGFNTSADKIKNSTENGFNSSADKIYDNIADSDTKGKEHISDEHMGVESDGKICDMLFENREIIDFVESVDDKNPIHRNEKAVVPGFLILEKFLEDNDLFGKEKGKDIFDFGKRRKEDKSAYVSKEEESAFKIEIKYLLPVFAGERIYLYNDKNMIKGMVQRSSCSRGNDRLIKVFEIKM